MKSARIAILLETKQEDNAKLAHIQLIYIDQQIFGLAKS